MIGSNLWPGYEPLYLARDLGYYSEEQIRLVEYSSATQVIQAFRNGSVQLVALTLDEVILLRQGGIDARVILVNDISAGGDVILAKPEIESLAALVGRKVGVENTALGAYFLTRALQIAGVSRDAIEVVPIEAGEHEEAYLNGEVDAVVTFEPMRSKLLKAGAHQLFDSTKTPGEIVDVMVVKAEDLEKFGPQVQMVVDGWYGALDHLTSDTEDACERMSKRLGISATEVEASYEGLELPDRDETRRMLSGDEPPLQKTAGQLVKVMREQQLIDGEVELSDLIDATAVIGNSGDGQ